MTLDEYKIALEKHDWFFYFSDDDRVCRAGEKAGQELLRKAMNGDDDFKMAYNAAHTKRFNVKSFVWEGNPYKIPFANLIDDPCF